MKKLLLLSISFSWFALIYAQQNNPDKHFSLSEIRASDDLELQQFTYNKEMLMLTTYTLFSDGIELKDSLIYNDFNNVIKLDLYQFMNNTWAYVAYIDYVYDEHLLKDDMIPVEE
ncbi:hypothetical protein DSECCO2_606510 [anaerobic digester metagenome]|nr:hypothetical protein [Lentimicrobiaceae bacterium]